MFEQAVFVKMDSACAGRLWIEEATVCNKLRVRVPFETIIVVVVVAVATVEGKGNANVVVVSD